MDDFEGDELVVGRVGGGDEEEGGVAAVDDFGLCGIEGKLVQVVLVGGGKKCQGNCVGWWVPREDDGPLYSRKLHMRALRASTSWETSLIILALSFGERVVNHLASRCILRQYVNFVSRSHKEAISNIPLCPAARAG